jgi:hypothetical protein
MPNWIWIDEDNTQSDEQIERITPLLNELAAQWSQITSAEEQRGFARQDAIENGDGPDFDTDAELADYRVRESQRSDLQQLRLEGIELQLAHHGARIMRPYEHWNEDEQFMQYQESRYDY